MLRLLTFIFILLSLPGISPARQHPDFTTLNALLKEAVANQKVAGLTLLLIHRGEPAYHNAFGYADLKTKTPFKKNAPVVIASISKPLLGTAVFRLAQAEELNLETPVSTYLPEFADLKLESGQAASRAPTLTELLSHTAGIRASKAEGGRPWLASWTHGKSLAGVVTRYAREYPLRAQPGTRYAYSGIGTDIAARTAEAAANQSRNELLIAQVAQPLGMSQTGYRNRDHLPNNMPQRYYLADSGTLLPNRPRPIPPPDTYSSSGGSIISTAEDLARWLLVFRNQGLHEGQPFFTKETLDAMLTPVPNSKNTACGFFARKVSEDGRALVIGHTGSTGTNCWIDFENDLIGIMLTQSSGENTKELRLRIEDHVTTLVTSSE
ncbi:MAG: serine hydrolase domain-containing protein [Verrucomicrobiota bacterium]